MDVVEVDGIGAKSNRVLGIDVLRHELRNMDIRMGVDCDGVDDDDDGNDDDDDDMDEYILLESQTNGARLIYTLSRVPPINTEVYCQLRVNGLYFFKVARSDEKLRYCESEIRSILRCVIFGYVFDCWPQESLLDLINQSPPIPTMQQSQRIIDYPLTLSLACQLLDHMFGNNFAQVTRHSLLNIYHEYESKWRYFKYGLSVRTPSVRDYLLLARFVNPTNDRYSNAVSFINANTTDDQVLYQSRMKIFS
nr:GrBNV_gp61-like protein [Apis mellifera nudivirus]